jgi:hypothetical protein
MIKAGAERIVSIEGLCTTGKIGMIPAKRDVPLNN